MEGRLYFFTFLGLSGERVSLGGRRERRVQIQIGRSWAVIRRRQGAVGRDAGTNNNFRLYYSFHDFHFLAQFSPCAAT